MATEEHFRTLTECLELKKQFLSFKFASGPRGNAKHRDWLWLWFVIGGHVVKQKGTLPLDPPHGSMADACRNLEIDLTHLLYMGENGAAYGDRMKSRASPAFGMCLNAGVPLLPHVFLSGDWASTQETEHLLCIGGALGFIRGPQTF